MRVSSMELAIRTSRGPWGPTPVQVRRQTWMASRSFFSTMGMRTFSITVEVMTLG